MESVVTIFTENQADANLYRQLAKRLNNRIKVEKVIKGQKLRSKEEFLDDLGAAAREVKLHMEGKVNLPTIEEIVDDL